jgi:hypothetical protein
MGWWWSKKPKYAKEVEKEVEPLVAVVDEDLVIISVSDIAVLTDLTEERVNRDIRRGKLRSLDLIGVREYLKDIYLSDPQAVSRRVRLKANAKDRASRRERW